MEKIPNIPTTEAGLSEGEKKVQEYIQRIKNGESQESVMDGLPPSFIEGIQAGMASQQVEGTVEIKESESARNQKIQEIRKDLGMEDEQTNEQTPDYSRVSELIERASQGKRQVVIDLYKNLFENIDEDESRRNLVSGLFQEAYNQYRLADYPLDPNEETTWKQSFTNTKVEVDNKKSEWMYHGIFPKNGEGTVTRGSFNVHVTPELIDSLDTMIADGKIKANYKFGQPGTPASPAERHDSISIYFLEQPDEDTLQELASIIKPHVRGDNLLGKKISAGFFMSEIGSIKDEHIVSFVESLKAKDPAFAESVKVYTSPRAGQHTSLKMSEAQFYAIKDVAHAFGYEISYDQDSGFNVTLPISSPKTYN